MAGSLGVISPLEDFLLAKEPHGLGYADRGALADALLGQNPDWKESTLKSTLSKYFNFALPLNKDFNFALRDLAHGELKDRLQDAIRQHDEEHQRREDPIGMMRRHYIEAKQVVYVGLEPISANLDFVPDSLVDLLKSSFEEIVSGKLSAIMGVPSRDIAIGIWKSVSGLIEARAKADPKHRSTAEVLEIVDQKLVLLVLPRRMCVHTTLLFDPDESNCVGYTWYMPWDWRSPVKMPQIVLNAWKQEFLEPIKARKLDGKPLVQVTRK
jgi:hypothetical protein